MSNGLNRLQSRFLADPKKLTKFWHVVDPLRLRTPKRQG